MSLERPKKTQSFIKQLMTVVAGVGLVSGAETSRAEPPSNETTIEKTSPGGTNGNGMFTLGKKFGQSLTTKTSKPLNEKSLNLSDIGTISPAIDETLLYLPEEVLSYDKLVKKIELSSEYNWFSRFHLKVSGEIDEGLRTTEFTKLCTDFIALCKDLFNSDSKKRVQLNKDLYNKIWAIKNHIDNNFIYVSDDPLYPLRNNLDLWNISLVDFEKEMWRGDCEDYAFLFKRFLVQEETNISKESISFVYAKMYDTNFKDGYYYHFFPVVHTRVDNVNVDLIVEFSNGSEPRLITIDQVPKTIEIIGITGPNSDQLGFYKIEK